MTIDLNNFDLGPSWGPAKLPPKNGKTEKTSPIPQGDGIVRVGRETKGRKGAGVTIVSGIAAQPDELKQLAKELKQKCGTGGTVKEGVIEIQGDQRDLLVDELKKRGYTVKKSGG
jgi:translation initiation factor 1